MRRKNNNGHQKGEKQRKKSKNKNKNNSSSNNRKKKTTKTTGMLQIAPTSILIFPSRWNFFLEGDLPRNGKELARLMADGDMWRIYGSHGVAKDGGGGRRRAYVVLRDGLCGELGRVIWWWRTGFVVMREGLCGDEGCYVVIVERKAKLG